MVRAPSSSERSRSWTSRVVGTPRARGLSGLGLGLCALALVRLAAHVPGAVERVYSGGLFPLLNGVQRGLFRLSPISVASLGIGALALLGLARLARGLRRVREGRRTGRAELGAIAGDALLIAGLAYAAFVGLWGLNHARRPYSEHAGLTTAPAGADELETAARELVVLCNRFHGRLARDAFAAGWRSRGGGVEPIVEGGFASLASEVPAVGSGRPLLRFPVVSPLLSRLGITGIYSPFTGEAHVNRDVPPVQQPFAACHEVAHQRGFAREDEANFIAWQVCLRSGDTGFAFSALLSGLAHALNALARTDPVRALAVLDGLDPAVVEERRATQAYWQAREGVMTEVSHRANDAYLRSQGQASGVQSYGRMLDLLLAERRRAGGLDALVTELTGPVQPVPPAAAVTPSASGTEAEQP